MGFSVRIPVLPTLAAVLLIALFIWLGFWQLDRAEYKQQLWAQFGRADSGEVTQVDSIDDLVKLDRYQPVRVTGQYVHSHQIFLDNRTYQGRPGVHVFTPMRLEDGLVLVNRGWLPLVHGRQNLPEAPVPKGTVTVAGLVSPPPPTGLVLGEVQLPETWPWLTPYLMLDRAQQALHYSLASQVLLLSPDAPGGFLRQWEPDTMPAARHIGYAVQWFALATAVWVVWVVMNVKRAKRKDKGARD